MKQMMIASLPDVCNTLKHILCLLPQFEGGIKMQMPRIAHIALFILSHKSCFSRIVYMDPLPSILHSRPFQLPEYQI